MCRHMMHCTNSTHVPHKIVHSCLSRAPAPLELHTICLQTFQLINLGCNRCPQADLQLSMLRICECSQPKLPQQSFPSIVVCMVEHDATIMNRGGGCRKRTRDCCACKFDTKLAEAALLLQLVSHSSHGSCSLQGAPWLLVCVSNVGLQETPLSPAAAAAAAAAAAPLPGKWTPKHLQQNKPK